MSPALRYRMYRRPSQLLVLMLSVTFVSGQLVSAQPSVDSRDDACCQRCNARQAAAELQLEQITARLDKLEQSFEVLEKQSQQRQPLQLQRQWTRRNRPGRLVSVKHNQTLTDDACTWGLTILNNFLYVSRKSDYEIRAYNVSTFNISHRFSIPGLRCVNDMASCPECDVFYVADRCLNKIYAIDGTELRSQWGVIDKPQGLSINSHLNVIVTFNEVRKLREFTPSGQLIREITLQSDVSNPWHAVQLDEGQYAVVHGWSDTDLHRVCIVNDNGLVLKSYGGNKGRGPGLLNVPVRLAMFGGSLIVADRYRVLLLNSTSLAFLQTVAPLAEDQGPRRMLISDDGTRLYLTQNFKRNGTCADGYIDVIRLKWDYTIL